MARIELRGIAHAYVAAPASEQDYALRPLELVWEDGGAYALLGYVAMLSALVTLHP